MPLISMCDREKSGVSETTNRYSDNIEFVLVVHLNKDFTAVMEALSAGIRVTAGGGGAFSAVSQERYRVPLQPALAKSRSRSCRPSLPVTSSNNHDDKVLLAFTSAATNFASRRRGKSSAGISPSSKSLSRWS